ncbi:hypothetical protein [Actinospica robiniae]|uniref:hypothetical protein n=1 Tax=Actinospica robiniae TaxID=304901 RepID=UPI00040F5E61|nr:hypothetical protein [Actinospica robiniae]
MLDAAAGAAYAVEISALQTYQSKLLGIMDSMVAQSVALGLSATVAGSGNAGLGNFPEAQSLGSAYQTSMQSLMTNFEEITQLVNTMTNVLGTAGKNYAETEQQLTDQFNQIAAQYEGKSGGFAANPTQAVPDTTPGSTTSSNSSTTTTDSSSASSGDSGQTYTSATDSSSGNDSPTT